MRSLGGQVAQAARYCAEPSIAKPNRMGVTGKPFNIASYALLLHMLAHVTGYEPGDFIHTLGDAHIYSNHMEQVALQLSRTPKPLPQLRITRNLPSIFDFRYDDFEITGYDPDPAISAPVAV